MPNDTRDSVPNAFAAPAAAAPGHGLAMQLEAYDPARARGAGAG